VKEKYNWWDVFKSSFLISIPILIWKLDVIIAAIKA
jgi:hypothetical protein